MECNVVRDLIPLYIDGCCSEQSKKNVEAHIADCADCRSVLENMTEPVTVSAISEAPNAMSRLNDWKASVLQSCLLFLSFVAITIGVVGETSSAKNGYYAITMVVPATGFLLSLANWYFVRFYKSRKIFSNSSLLVTFGITLCGYAWTVVHYKIYLSGFSAVDPLFVGRFYGIGTLMTVTASTLSKVFSARYAKLLGKE